MRKHIKLQIVQLAVLVGGRFILWPFCIWPFWPDPVLFTFDLDLTIVINFYLFINFYFILWIGLYNSIITYVHFHTLTDPWIKQWCPARILFTSCDSAIPAGVDQLIVVLTVVTWPHLNILLKLAKTKL